MTTIDLDLDHDFRDDPPRLLHRVLRRIAFIAGLIVLFGLADWLAGTSTRHEPPDNTPHARSAAQDHESCVVIPRSVRIG